MLQKHYKRVSILFRLLGLSLPFGHFEPMYTYVSCHSGLDPKFGNPRQAINPGRTMKV